MKKINFKLIIFSAIVTLVFNSVLIVLVAFTFEKEAKLNNYTQLEDILKSDNKNLSYDDFVLLNWAYSREDAMSSIVLPKSVKNTEFIRCNRVESVFVQLLQTKNNSIVQLFPSEGLNDNNVGGANSASVLKIGDIYYLVVCVTENKDLPTAVYKTKDDLSSLYELETDKSRYSSYEFYPFSLAPLFSTTFDKVLNVLFVIGEVAVVYLVLVWRHRRRDKDKTGEDKTGDGSMIES